MYWLPAVLDNRFAEVNKAGIAVDIMRHIVVDVRI